MRNVRNAQRTWMPAAVVAIAALPSMSSAAPITAVRPIPGYVCMSLSPQDQQATRQDQLPPIYAGPSKASAKIGYPTGVVFVKTPVNQVDGLVQMLRLNGQVGWIAATHLRPWHPMTNNGATCTPSVMSNGRLGIG